MCLLSCKCLHWTTALMHFSLCVCLIICCFRMTPSSANLLARLVVSGSRLSQMTSQRNLMHPDSLVRTLMNGLSKLSSAGVFLLTLTSVYFFYKAADLFCLWRHGIVVMALVSINEVNLCWARLVLGWVTVSGFDFRRRHFISVCNQPPRST